MKRHGVEAGFRPLFRFKNLSAVTLWLALVLFMALFIDRPVIAAMASAPVFVETLGHVPNHLEIPSFQLFAAVGLWFYVLVWD